MTESNHPLPLSCLRLLRFGQVLILACLALFAGALIFEMVQVFYNGEQVDAGIKEDVLQQPYDGSFSTPQRFFAVLMMPISALSGLIALFLTLQLFQAYRHGKVFTSSSSRRLRLIGWLVMLLTPLGMIAEALSIAIFTQAVEPGRINISLEFSDGEVYALVFGLLIVIVGQVMVKATEISEENEAIV